VPPLVVGSRKAPRRRAVYGREQQPLRREVAWMFLVQDQREAVFAGIPLMGRGYAQAGGDTRTTGRKSCGSIQVALNPAG